MGTYVVTGATRGIGLAVAELLHERGHDLVLAGRNAEALAELEKRLPGSRSLVVDLRAPEGIEPAVAGLGPLPSLDGLVHSAGAIELGEIAKTPYQVWQDLLTVNLVAVAELTRVLLPALRAARGHVVFVNSGSGLRAKPEWGAYAASKHGLRALADALREEEHVNGIRVTSVYLGRVATEMQRKIHEYEGSEFDPSKYIEPRTVALAVLAALETPRDAEVTEVTVRPGA